MRSVVELRYGINPHQSGRILNSIEQQPFRIINGNMSYVNILDAANSWQLVREVRSAIDRPTAASFKHVSPAGVAIAGDLDSTTVATWGHDCAEFTGVASAYVRARDCDPRSSFGDMVAVSDPVDADLAHFLAGVVSDGIIAPGFEAGTVATLTRKKRGAFLVLEADTTFDPPARERRDIMGLTVEQDRDQTPITTELLTVVEGKALTEQSIRDALLGLVAMRYTQSNSVAFIHDGATVGIGAGQQSRVDCTRLAAAKASTWWTRRSDSVRSLARPDGMTRQDHANWQMRLIEGDLTPLEVSAFIHRFGFGPTPLATEERANWIGELDNVTMVSDGFLPFRDNVDHASRVGTRHIVEPGGSVRSIDVATACSELGIDLIHTGLRLFHH
ncbi:5-aminoimidazole-4-carboxamide ribonucleotide transformylase [Rhodococcus sp. SRB_17]|nr:5-aminoimidazole-4-carboxamide ribonucleotide transformylase [Rhodococcus sp. SRB_17]